MVFLYNGLKAALLKEKDGVLTDKKFLTGLVWKPQEGEFGILPMIVGSIYATGIAILVGVPIGLLCSVFMARFCPGKLYKILKPAISLLAGIPSIVYGFFGLVVLVPIMQSIFGVGKSVLTAGILLGIMILPTIIEISESSIRAVPDSYYEGSLALGATHERSVYCATLPAAKSGIMAGIILGIGMAVDANVVIFERIREEVKNGRPIGSAVRKGFSNALSAIIDSNVTTIIAAVVLYAFGTGSVRGFALTLGIGVATSLFTAVFVTHKLLDIFADLGIKNQKLYV